MKYVQKKVDRLAQQLNFSRFTLYAVRSMLMKLTPEVGDVLADVTSFSGNKSIDLNTFVAYYIISFVRSC
jgi:hypothetical protein